MKLRDFHRNIKIRLLEDFLSKTISTMIFPFMAIYFAAHFGAKMTGMILILNVVMGMISGLYGGYFADRMGRKKMLQLSGLLRIGAYTIMTIVNSPWIEMPVITFFMMMIVSICWGISGPASSAMLVDVSTPENRKYVYTVSYWLTNLSVTIGSASGSFFIKSHRFELFVSLTIVSIITFLLVYLFIEETYAAKAETYGKRRYVLKEMADNYRLVLKDGRFLKYLVSVVFIMALELQLTNYTGIRLEREMTVHTFSFNSGHFLSIDGVRMMGLLQTENTILVVSIAAAAGLLFKRFQERKLLMFGLFIYTIGYCIIGFSNTPLFLVVAMLFATIGEIIYSPITQSKLAEIIDDNHRSAYMAVSGMRYNMGMILTSLFVSISSIMPGWMMAVLFLLMGFCSMFLLNDIFTEKINRRNPNTATTIQAKV